jgi:hypothetical protein
MRIKENGATLIRVVHIREEAARAAAAIPPTLRLPQIEAVFQA